MSGRQILACFREDHCQRDKDLLENCRDLQTWHCFGGTLFIIARSVQRCVMCNTALRWLAVAMHCARFILLQDTMWNIVLSRRCSVVKQLRDV